ncbi:MAG TPA: alpha-amylase family glycosyl hydrolase [Verrucomicrobiae bacterium]|jgi:glycosidase|nr:alpha-amylase family glycosyl hydrolase [Verrucomicrobiae bacterium]
MKKFLLLMTIGGIAAGTYGQVTVDGTLNPSEGYGNPFAVQTVNTGFGDNTSSNGASSGGSELDAVYAVATNGYLYLFIAGNVQNNGNNIDVFIAGGQSGGQHILEIGGSPGEAAMNGSTFSAGFTPHLMLTFIVSNTTLSVDEVVLSGASGVEASLGSIPLIGGVGNNQDLPGGFQVGFNDLNTAGVNGNSGTAANQAAAKAVTTGLELAIPLSALGNPTNSIEVLVGLNGSGFAYLSNQFLPGLAVGTGNLGANGGGAFNFGSTTGEYFTAPVSASAEEAPVLTVNGINADYGTTHVFVDEVANDAAPLTILFSPNASNVVEADVFSNLNRRDHAGLDANGDGIEDGILPPDGNTIATGDTNNYYEAYAMSPTGTAGQYALTLYAQKTGAYRLTTRFKVAGGTNWIWYGTNAPYISGLRRDFGIVVSPKKAEQAVIYELAVNNIGAQGVAANGSQRSTFTDLYNGPGSRAYDPVTNRFNLNYVTNLGVNWVWIEPIHPIGIAGSINSPYCVKDYFAVSPWMSKANTRAAGLQEFQGFVAAADAAGVNVMMDVPFDHTAHDVELDIEGIIDFAGAGNPGKWTPTDLVSNRLPQFFSSTGDYCARAAGANDIAIAPDRGDFSKWTDVSDVFYGVYDALVCENPQDNNNYWGSDDWFDYSATTGSFDGITQNVWKYFANSILFWLNETGCTNGTPASQTSVGIDGIRADFGEGLPPQCWEYIINKVRSQKWDFVFLAESLNGGAPTYRSSRDFDIVNDSVLYNFRTAASATDYQNIFNTERSSYGQCLMLWNSASHDVGGYYTDPYQALIRFMVGATIDGAPHLFYGQEAGTTAGFGFNLYTKSGTEEVPDLFTFNSLQPAFAAGAGNLRVDQLYPLFSSVGQARQASPALCCENRYFLNTIGSPQPNIYAVAKYQTAGGEPNSNDVVFAFVNLDVTNGHQGNFNVNVSQNGSNLFGIQPDRLYNIKNLAAYTAINPSRRPQFLLSNGIAGSNLLSNGLSIQLNPVPANNAGWTNSPFEAQYLKLFDVTPPTSLAAPVLNMENKSVLSWTSISGMAYQILSTTNLAMPFAPLGGTITASGTTTQRTNNFGDPARFFRLQVFPQ